MQEQAQVGRADPSRCRGEARIDGPETVLSMLLRLSRARSVGVRKPENKRAGFFPIAVGISSTCSRSLFAAARASHMLPAVSVRGLRYSRTMAVAKRTRSALFPSIPMVAGFDIEFASSRHPRGPPRDPLSSACRCLDVIGCMGGAPVRAEQSYIYTVSMFANPHSPARNLRSPWDRRPVDCVGAPELTQVAR